MVPPPVRSRRRTGDGPTTNCARSGSPLYIPPQFADGSYIYAAIEGLGDTHGCIIRFLGVDTQYPEDLEVRIDGAPAFSVGRYRDDHGNTVYEMSANEFREAV